MFSGVLIQSDILDILIVLSGCQRSETPHGFYDENGGYKNYRIRDFIDNQSCLEIYKQYILYLVCIMYLCTQLLCIQLLKIAWFCLNKNSYNLTNLTICIWWKTNVLVQ